MAKLADMEELASGYDRERYSLQEELSRILADNQGLNNEVIDSAYLKTQVIHYEVKRNTKAYMYPNPELQCKGNTNV